MLAMKNYILNALKTKTARQSAVTSLATIINGLLGVAFYILTARFLGPEDFGILVVALTTLTLVADVAAVGTDTGIVKFVGQYYEKDREKALKFLKLGFKIKLIVGILVLAAGWFLAAWIADDLLAKPELATPLRFAIGGSFATLLFTFATSSLQAIQKFWTWGAVNVSANALRLGLVIVLVLAGLLNVESTLISYIVCIVLGFFVSLLFLPNFFKAKQEGALAKEFLHYNKWVAAFILIAAVSGKLDTFLATRLLSLKEVGIYGVATGLAVIGAQIVAGITTVVAPKLASLDTDRKAIDYLKKLQLLVIGLGIAAVMVGIPTGYFIIPVLYGSQYLASFVPLAILIVAQALFLISIPAHSATIYYFAYPKLFVYISLVHLAIIGGLGYILITNFGVTGAAVTVLIGNISNLVIPGVWVLSKFSKK